MIYAGIGARDLPEEYKTPMVNLARYMASYNHTLRSGGANGADTAFEKGCDVLSGKKEIYLPKKGFNKNPSPLFGSTREARQIAKHFHPYWENLGCYARDFMGRNTYQILGLDLKTPADCVICWTPEGKIVGGTGQALRMAEHYHIPVFNLGECSLEESNEKIVKFLLCL